MAYYLKIIILTKINYYIITITTLITLAITTLAILTLNYKVLTN
jgi:hypothetical protein